MICLGIDTSCYRTSVAIASEDGYAQRRELLRVPQGKRGLQQSEMVFQHVKALPGLIEALLNELPVGERIGAVCVSTRPRPVEGSYMPAFAVGEGIARSLSAALGVPCFETSHQQGHLRAAMLTSDMKSKAALADGPFLALHLSGGTTELLLSDRDLNAELLGGSTDIPAGMLIDRVGVALGCPFPAGPDLERLAARAEPGHVIPTAIKGMDCSFSGAEAQAMRLIEAGELGREQIAAEVFSLVARTLAKLIRAGMDSAGADQALIFGGVASSQLLRPMLRARLDRLQRGTKLLWADPELSGDNAVGVAYIGLSKLKSVLPA